jgi:hypothetical protein
MERNGQTLRGIAASRPFCSECRAMMRVIFNQLFKAF